jgi:hypothetical protein
VTDEAVDFRLVRKIERCILPAIARVTTRAAGPVGGEGDAEIVDGVGRLSQVDLLFMTLKRKAVVMKATITRTPGVQEGVRKAAGGA